MQTSLPPVFAAGNVVHVNDLADNVSLEGMIAGKYAALYAAGKLPRAGKPVNARAGENVRYVCPASVAQMDGEATLRFRALSPLRGAEITVTCGDKLLALKRAVRLSPGEMEHIEIDLREIGGDDCVVAARGERL
jgi:hypothetical protein